MLLQANGLHSPEVVAVLEKRTGLAETRNILVTKELAGKRPLTEFFGADWPQAGRHALVKELGKAIGRMHAAGIIHGDLRAGNIFAGMDASGWHFSFIDNERTQKYTVLAGRYRIKNLVQLNLLSGHLSLSDRLRFFSAYAKMLDLDRMASRKIAVAIAKKTMERIRDRVRRGLSVPDFARQMQ